VRALPARNEGRLHVCGCLQRKHDWPPFICEPAVHPDVVRACGEAWSKIRKKKTVVVMENVAVHTSEALEACLSQWPKQGRIVQDGTPSAPALNLRERLWRNIPDAWLPLAAYPCLNVLRDALENILKSFGSKYQITFA